MPKRGRLMRVVWGLVAAMIVAGMAAPAATAAEGQVRVVDRFKIVPPANATDDPLNGSLVLNPGVRRAYQLFVLVTGESLVRVLDLDTLETLGEVKIPNKPASPGGRSAPGEWLATVDPNNDRLYFSVLAPPSQGGGWGGIAMVDGSTMTGKVFERGDAVDPTKAVTDREECSDVTTSACQPQLAGITPLGALWALEFSSSYLTGLQDKILLLFQEMNAPTLETNSSMVWLLQWDAATGRQDWMYRVQSCQQRTLPTSDSSRFSLSIIQGGGGQIYIGCNATGATGQAVRLTVDPLNKPTFEEAFPGPTNVADILSDPNDDRLLFRVSNEEGESFWVFNGRASAYSGVVGLTLEPASIGAGVDRESGRLYVMAPPTAKFGQVNPGGLIMSDIRRNPAPQGLQFPDLAQPAYFRLHIDPRAKDGTRRVFFRPSQPVEASREYLIIQDDVAVTTDPPLTDLDRFTVDTEEKEGVTARNFTATGHGYGFRYIYVGGLEGVPPTGPDLSSMRVGREAPRWLGSPCNTGDRRMTLASAQQAQFSNNIMSAAAIPGEPDPGTQTDLGQPGERCYPYPAPLGQDVYSPFKPLIGPYPRPLDENSDVNDSGEQTERDGHADADELLGQKWPFGAAQCSDGKDATGMKYQPLDRDVDLAQRQGIEPDATYAPVRDQEVSHRGFQARVECDPKKGLVNAHAELIAAEEEAPAFEQKEIPGIGTIRVGDISSHISLYIDKDRGLVSRTESIAREIQIGNKIYIDKAWTIGEAWANGRFGGASTSFKRRLCGVRFPENSVHLDPAGDKLDTDPIHVGSVGDVYVGDVDPLGPESDNVNQEFDMQGCGESPVALPQNIPVAQQPLIDAMNRVLGPRGRVRAPDPDGELRQGTPGGYLASVQKDRLEQVGSRAVNNDDSTQVPALEIVLFNDDPTRGRGRQVYQFAGVDASVTYGIYLLNPPQDDPIPPCLDPLCGAIPDPPVLDPAPPPTGPTPVGGGGSPPPRGPLGPITVLFSGVSFLVRSPRDLVLAAAVWGLLFAPMHLSLRRRALKAVS